MSNPYEIKLGIQFDDGELKNIKKQLTNLTDNTHRIRIDIDNSRLLKQIDHAKKELKELNGTKGNQPSLTINTQSLEKSLNRVANVVDEVRKSLGALDDKSGMKDILSSINQMTKALGKAENESDSLVKSLSALSKKDLSFNFGFNMGKSASQVASEQGDIKRSAISQLKQQAKALEDYLDQYYKVAQQKEGVVKLTQGTNLFSSFWEMSPNIGNTKLSLKQQVDTYKQYINLMQEAAKIKGVDLSGIFSGFSKSTDDIVKETSSAANGVEQLTQAFKGLFGGSIDAEGLSASLDIITKDLTEIREAVVNLSSGVSLDGLTQSFDRLSETIEKLVSNAALVKNVLGDGFGVGPTSSSSVNNAVSTAQQTGHKIGEAVGKSATQSAKQSINIDDVLDRQTLDLMDKYSIIGDKGSKAFNEIRQALVECRNEINILKNSDIGVDEEVFDTSRAVDKVTDAIANQIRAVNNLGDEYIELANYMTRFNDPLKGNKVRLPDVVKQEQGDNYKSNRGVLGAAFNAKRGISFVDFINDLNHELGDTISLTNGEAAAMDELLHKVEIGRQQRDASKKSDKYLSSTASTEEILEQNGINREEIYGDVMSIAKVIDSAEQQIAQASTTAANTVARNEERKQQAYRETAKEFLAIQKGSFQRAFSPADEASGGINNTAKSVEAYFKSINGVLADTVSVQERFDADKNLNGFTVSLKNANGAAEQLRYTLRTIEDTGDALFEYTGGSINDNGVLKQMNAISAKADTLQNKLDKLKSSYSDQNVSRPIKDDNHITALSEQYDKVEKAIIGVRNADESTFASMVSNAQREITTLETMVSEFKNAENVASKMKSTDFASGLDIAKNDLEKFKAEAKDFPQITQTIENLDKAIEGVGDASSLNRFNDQLRVARSELAKIKSETSAANKSEKVGINVSGLESKIADLQRISPEVDKFEAEIDGAKVSVQSLLNDLKKVNTQSDFSVVNSKWRAFTDAAKAAGIAVTETAAKAKSVLANDIKLNIELGNFDNEMDTMIAKFNSLSDANDDLRRSYDVTKDAYKAMMDAADANTGDEIADRERLIQAEKEYAAALEKTNNLIKIQARADKIDADRIKLQDNRELFQAKIDVWMEKNSAATKKFGADLLALRAKAEKADQVELNHLEKELLKIDKAADKAGLKMQSFGDQIKSKFKEYMAYFSVAEVFMYAEQALREMFNTVLEIDTAMTGLHRVTDLTASQYDSLFNNMISSAKEYGATLNDIINATTDWVRAGFDADTALGMAEVTTMYQHISDLDYDTAAENLITAYNGFKNELLGLYDGDEVAAVQYIADVFNELDNNFAITSAGLGEAMKRSASALDLAGNSIQETAGMITGITEVTQDPEKAGKVCARTYSNVWCNYKIA